MTEKPLHEKKIMEIYIPLPNIEKEIIRDRLEVYIHLKQWAIAIIKKHCPKKRIPAIGRGIESRCDVCMFLIYRFEQFYIAFEDSISFCVLCYFT